MYRTSFVIFLIAFWSFCSYGSYAQSTESEPFQKEWKMVDSLENKGLYRQALKKVEEIFQLATEANIPDEAIKSVLFQLKYNTFLEEEDLVKGIAHLDRLIKTSSSPTKEILHSLAAEVYWGYYNKNSWKIQERTQTPDLDLLDVRTWDLRRIATKIVEHFQQSLSNEEVTLNTPIVDFKKVLVEGYDEETIQSRPTIYDFLVYRALDFYESNSFNLPGKSETFAVDRAEFLKPYQQFRKLKILVSNGELNTSVLAFQLFQNALEKRVENKEVFFALELKRLQYAKSKAVFNEKEDIYESTLAALEKQFSNYSFSSEATFLRAQQYTNWASSYDLLEQSPSKYKYANQVAIDLCDEAIERYPNSFGAKQCQVLKSSILQKELNVKGVEASSIGEELLFQLSFRNINQVYLKVVPFNYENQKKSSVELEQTLSKVPGIRNKKIILPTPEDYRLHRTEINLKGLEQGFYYIVVSSSDDFKIGGAAFSYFPIWISNLTFQTKYKSGYNNQTVLVSDRTTGQPIEGAKVKVTYEKYNPVSRSYVDKLLGIFTTDEKGQVSYKTTSKFYSYNIAVSKGDDFFDPVHKHYIYQHHRDSKKKTQVSLYTDRTIYRPGQSVFVKGIVIEYSEEERKLLPNYTTNLVIFDANNQKIDEKEVTTNEYGSFQGEFEIPFGILTGQFKIEAANGTTFIRVEEYKRPRFTTEINPVEGAFQLNDSIEIKGKAIAFSGNPIGSAEVQYRVERTVNYPSWIFRNWGNNSVTKEIEFGRIETDDNGNFAFKFIALPDVSIPAARNPMFTYSITVTVTDINGETHEASSQVIVGYQSMILSNNLGAEIEKNQEVQLQIQSNNLNGQKIPAKGVFTISALKQPRSPLVDRLWETPDLPLLTKDQYKELFPSLAFGEENEPSTWEVERVVLSRNFDTEVQDSFALEGLTDWVPGVYRYEAKSTDKNGVEVKDVRHFIVYAKTEKSSPTKSFLWTKLLNPTAQPGDTVELLLASACNDAFITYEIEAQNELFESRVISLSNEQKRIKIPVLEAYRGNFVVQLTMVKNNRVFVANHTVFVPYKNKELAIAIKTFRDKLLPGADEEWTLTIRNVKGGKESAEMLATLYDASLDELYITNTFNLDIYPYYSGIQEWSGAYGSTVVMGRNNHQNWNKYVAYPSRKYPVLNYFGYHLYGRNFYYYDAALTNSGVLYDDVESDAKGEIGRKVNNMDRQKDPSTFPNQHEEEQQVDISQIQARNNFQETAFFYPQLHTDSSGNISIKFTIPESLTKWKFTGLAHTKELKIGTITKTLITQKDLMVVPNVPRFLREADELVLSTKIANLSDHDLAGEAQLELLDPSTDEILNIQFELMNGKQNFMVKQGQSTVVKWKVKVPKGLSIVKYRFVAASGSYSDGEESVLPILNNRMLITESLPLPIRGNETKSFKFQKLIDSKKSKSQEQHRFTIEFTSNPIWYAVQAMPYMMEYPYECSEQLFTRYYSNAIATHLMNSNPKIRAIIDNWGENSPEAFYSSLQKNEELKSLLLQETPWVVAAQNEEESRRNLATLLDIGRMEKELDVSLTKILKAQSVNGGWPWFPGMKENRYITQHIVTGIGHLNHLGITPIKSDSRVDKMVKKAVQYLDETIVKDYLWAKKHDNQYLKNKHLGYNQIQYLYARSYFSEIGMSEQTKIAVNYYLDQAQQFWKEYSLAGEAMLSLGLQRMGMTSLAKDIYKSLKDRAIHSEEFGMYWKEYQASYYWYQAPIETQALMVEMFGEVGADTEAVDELKIWLLKQKQTTNWKTTKQTTEAVYALLQGGDDLLETDEFVQVELNNQEIKYVEQPSTDPFEVKADAGTGYFKTTWSGEEIKPEFGNISVSKTTEGVAWGAAYWQYFEDLDKVSFAETNLKLKKELFIVSVTDQGEVLKQIKSQSDLKIGDKIRVRIELRSDRNLEYVHMKDMRASGFEPINVLSRYHYQDGLGYYQATKDASTNFFFDYIPKGTYVFEYDLRVQHAGEFSNGITTIQCMYAPEFTSHSEGIRVKVEEKK